MASPVPKHIRTPREIEIIDPELRDHINDIKVNAADGINLTQERWHKAKYAPGLSTQLLRLANSDSIGDPMAGTGRFFEETNLINGAANDIDPRCFICLEKLSDKLNLTISNKPASEIEWFREVLIFSPPYYPRTDRKKPNAHNDIKRGPIVGFRDNYGFDSQKFVGNPAGANGILFYRNSMRDIYRHLLCCGNQMIVVVKNWTRLGTELRLDLDTILIAEEAGWRCRERHGWQPPQSLWARFNEQRGTGVNIEDILIFDKR